MKNYEITAWKNDGASQVPEWSKWIWAESLGDALSRGRQLFSKLMPDEDISEYDIHAAGTR